MKINLIQQSSENSYTREKHFKVLTSFWSKQNAEEYRQKKIEEERSKCFRGSNGYYKEYWEERILVVTVDIEDFPG